MAQNDIYRVTMVQSCNDNRIANVFYYQQTTIDGATNSNQLLGDGMEASLNPVMVTNLGAGWRCLCYEISKVGVTGQPFFRVLSSENPGVRVGRTYPADVCAVVANFTQGGGRSGTGRWFVSGLTDEQENDNNLNASGLGQIDLIGDQFILPITEGGVTFQAGRYNPLGSPVFDPWILSDVRVPITKIKSRRQSLRC